MQTIADRINQRMAQLNISQAEIHRATGAGKATISNWVDGTTEPSAKHLIKLSICLKCTSDWLIGGNTAQNQFDNNNGYVGGSVNQSVVNHYADFSCEDKLNKILPITFYPTANTQIDAQILYLTRQQLPNPSENLVATVVFDDSMQPVIKEKSLVVADTTKASGVVYSGKVYLIDMSGLLICRYLEQLAGGKIRLLSEKDNKGQVLGREEFDADYKIIGGVVWWASFVGW